MNYLATRSFGRRAPVHVVRLCHPRFHCAGRDLLKHVLDQLLNAGNFLAVPAIETGDHHPFATLTSSSACAAVVSSASAAAVITLHPRVDRRHRLDAIDLAAAPGDDAGAAGPPDQALSAWMLVQHRARVADQAGIMHNAGDVL